MKTTVPDILLDRSSRESLHEQIARQIAKSIRDGELGHGARLPSTRALARLLAVSRNTVLVAYETLAAADLIQSMCGSGSRVHNRAPITLPNMGSLLHDARYPERITLLSDPDGNRLYLRHDR